MKLSAKCRYGTRAMIEIARNEKNGPVKRKVIVQAQEISRAYLENILISLKMSKLIRTVRGANGGFVLEKKAVCYQPFPDRTFAGGNHVTC